MVSAQRWVTHGFLILLSMWVVVLSWMILELICFREGCRNRWIIAKKKLECLPSKLLTESVGILTIFGHIYIWCNSNFDGRHSNFFCAIIHLFLHPSLKQTPESSKKAQQLTQKRVSKNPWVTHAVHYWWWPSYLDLFCNPYKAIDFVHK